jgi:hypothetical protein
MRIPHSNGLPPFDCIAIIDPKLSAIRYLVPFAVDPMLVMDNQLARSRYGHVTTIAAFYHPEAIKRHCPIILHYYITGRSLGCCSTTNVKCPHR